MQWFVRERMKRALDVVEMIPDVHRTPAMAALRKAALSGGTKAVRLSAEEREMAYYDGQLPLISPIGARVLKALYHEGLIRLKKKPLKSLPALEAYIATEPAFRAEIARLTAEEDARQQRIAEICADPSLARPDELTPHLIDKVFIAQLGYGACGSLKIAGLDCHKTATAPQETGGGQTRAEISVACWWVDEAGHRQGDAG